MQNALSRAPQFLIFHFAFLIEEKCQGDHGGCGANYRCCLPALAGFVSPHSMGPGKIRRKFKPRFCAQQGLFSARKIGWQKILVFEIQSGKLALG